MSGAVLSDVDWAVRANVYRGFAERGRAPELAVLSGRLGLTGAEVRASFARLFEAHELAIHPNGSGVWMANPFSAVETDFVVETPRMTCWASCAWDALGVPAMLGVDGWTRTHCAASGEPLEFGVRGGRLGGDEGLIHLVTPIARVWDDIGFT